jgi:hypothetical protein
MDFDLESNLNPQFPHEMKIKIETVKACIKIIENERDTKLKALALLAEDEQVRQSTLDHYRDGIDIFVESLTKLLNAVIDEVDGFKSDDNSPETTF